MTSNDTGMNFGHDLNHLVAVFFGLIHHFTGVVFIHNLGMIGFNLRQVDVGGIRFNQNNVFIKNHSIHIYI